MKTGHVSQGSAFLKQTKLVRDDKTANKKEEKKDVSDRIDLSTKKVPAIPTVVASYEEALELLYGIDFNQLKNTGWVSDEGRAQLLELSQS